MTDNIIISELQRWQHSIASTLYFPEGIFIKYSPRSASQSLKSLLIDLTLPDTGESFLWKKRLIQNLNINDYYITTRIAVKRDPIDRFLSALNWDYDHWGKGEYYNTVKCPGDIDSVLEKNGWFDFMFANNKHYFPQTFYLKSSKDYDLIFDVQNLSHLVKWINEQYATDLSVPWVNSSGKYFTKDMLSEKHILMIQDRYSVDYNNGWY